MSCEDLQDNSSIVQGSANDEFFKAGAVASRADSGDVSISANTELENLTLNLTNVSAGTYPFGPGSLNTAIFTDLNGQVFSTQTSAGDGAVIISEYNTANNTVTGSFIFNAYTVALADTLNFQRGVIFQVPVIGAQGEIENLPLVQAMTATIDGTSFVAETINGIDVSGSVVVTGIEGTRTVVVRFNNSFGPGEYDLASGDFTATYSLDGSATAGTAGTLRIDSHEFDTNEITGTFGFTGAGFEVVEGSFAVTY